MKYFFKEIERCEMCGDSVEGHKILGQRLNQSQGLRPRKKTGISVTIQRCTNCNLIYSNPQPIPNDLQDHYGTPPEDYWRPEYFNWTPDYFARQIHEVKELMEFKPGMRALDIGAGLGKAMKSLDAAGFDAYGMEPSIPFYERAISKMGIDSEKLKAGAIEELEYPENSFDFITFGAVFEHLYSPSLCLERALKWVKPTGLIQIEVPSSKWLLSKLINFYYRMCGTTYVTNLSPMHSPFHLHEFDVKSFEALAKKLDFSIVMHRIDVCTIFNVPSFLHPFFRWYMEKTKTGMQLTLYLRKN